MLSAQMAQAIRSALHDFEIWYRVHIVKGVVTKQSSGEIKPEIRFLIKGYQAFAKSVVKKLQLRT